VEVAADDVVATATESSWPALEVAGSPAEVDSVVFADFTVRLLTRAVLGAAVIAALPLASC
jgi:hypothetical protein